MSGGVDSSVAALLMKQAGYEVIGFHMHLTSEGTGCGRACCSLDSAEDARRVANALEIPFYVVNLEEQFKREVIGVSRAAYKVGQTPNPCILCNRHMKFKYLLAKARELGCSSLTTGHYVRKIDEHAFGEFILRMGVDKAKDQSYYLYFLDQAMLQFINFPLGWFTKEGTRIMAAKAGLKVASKPDSQDICFRLMGDETAGEICGVIVDEDGSILAHHTGIANFTVGQRKGLGVAVGYPLYVREINAETNCVVVAPDDRIVARGLSASRISLVSRKVIEKIAVNEYMVDVKVRSRLEMHKARVRFLDDNRADFEFRRPVRAVCPGQAVVMYLDDEMLGGGTIEKARY